MGQHVSALSLKRKIKKEKRRADKSFEKKRKLANSIKLDTSSSSTPSSPRKRLKDEESEEEPLSFQLEQGDSSSSASAFNSWYCDSQEDLSLVNRVSMQNFELWHELPTEMKHKVLTFLPLLVLFNFSSFFIN